MGLSPQHHYRIDLFWEFLNAAKLMDMNLKGSKFTCMSSPRKGFVTREKIDRVLVNWPWRIDFPRAMASALPIIGSDHAPIVF